MRGFVDRGKGVGMIGVVGGKGNGEVGGSSTGDNAIGHCAFLFFGSWAGAG
jgi:hypothetical protein